MIAPSTRTFSGVQPGRQGIGLEVPAEGRQRPRPRERGHRRRDRVQQVRRHADHAGHADRPRAPAGEAAHCKRQRAERQTEQQEHDASGGDVGDRHRQVERRADDDDHQEREHRDRERRQQQGHRLVGYDPPARQRRREQEVEGATLLLACDRFGAAADRVDEQQDRSEQREELRAEVPGRARVVVPDDRLDRVREVLHVLVQVGRARRDRRVERRVDDGDRGDPDAPADGRPATGRERHAQQRAHAELPSR